MVELPQNTSNSKQIKDKKTQFLLIFLILVLEITFPYTKEIKILTALIFLTMYSYILLTQTIQHFFCK